MAVFIALSIVSKIQGFATVPLIVKLLQLHNYSVTPFSHYKRLTLLGTFLLPYFATFVLIKL